MRSKLFEYVIILHPTLDDNDREIGKAELLVQPVRVLAKLEKDVAIMAARLIPESMLDHLDRIDIVIRPF